MNKELADLRKKNIEQLSAELISARETQFGPVSYTHLTLPTNC